MASGDNAPRLRVRRVRTSAELPVYQTSGAAGLDLRADLEAPLTLRPGERGLISTGLQVEIPDGYEGQVRARSGLALRHGLAVLNAPGTIDADYRGELQVILHNAGLEPVEIRHGERIAQLVIAPVVRVDVVEVDELSPSERGDRGFGSTGP